MFCKKDPIFFIDQQKPASVFWISPFGQLVASNRSIDINITAGYQLVEFPPNLPRMPGLWSAILFDHEQQDFTEIQFAVFSKKFSSFPEHPIVEEVISEAKVATFVDTIKGKKIAENHHSLEAIKSWIKTVYQLSSHCQVQNGLCNANNWSSRSPDTKSTINF